ncbi:MAG: hypothetical protein NTX22_07595 [Ignavibacteriales bacterium]|nr:hypothetical protein [Ignavibacteriales bacterium]
MNYKRIISLLLFLQCVAITLFLNLSCKKSPTEPTDNIKPGSRNYVWTVDTLNYPYNTIYRIWGSSPSDVWAISGGGDLDKTIFHFDGNKWTTDGRLRPISPSSIWGFSAKDIWIGGMNGMIWHYDGNGWKEIKRLTKDGNTQIVFDNMWGESSDDFYSFGAYPTNEGAPNNSVIAHYTNNTWTILNTDELIGLVEHLYKNKVDNRIYLQVIRMGGGEYFDSTLLYEYYQGKYNKFYSSIWDKGVQADISLINNEVYFILGNEIANRIDNQFKTMLKVENPNFYQRIWGRNEKDIFLLMTDGLAHYNGIDIEYLFYFTLANKLPWTQIFGAVIFDKELFFITYEPTTNLNLIYHGKLK